MSGAAGELTPLAELCELRAAGSTVGGNTAAFRREAIVCAHAVGPHEVRVEGRLLEADRIFLNVGARAMVPDMPGLSDIDYMTNVELLELDTAPEHLVIVGGSYIGLQFPRMYRCLRHNQGDFGGRRHRRDRRRQPTFDSLKVYLRRVPSRS
jgi:Pyridine nucleotide-disulphide oxidoreductase